MLLFLSAVIVEIMNRYRWIAYLGTAVLALTAADLMVQDFELFYRTRMDQGSTSPTRAGPPGPSGSAFWCFA